MAPNPWFVHLSAFRKAHPNLSMKQCMRSAKKTYKKVSSGVKKVLRKSSKVRKSNKVRKSSKVRKSRKHKKHRKGKKGGNGSCGVPVAA